MSPATAIEYGLIAAGVSVAIIVLVNGLSTKKAPGAEYAPAAIVQPVNTR